MSLVSKWADDPELVNKAKQQDTHKTITVKKGENLVSRWAQEAEDDHHSAKGDKTLKIRPEDQERLDAIRERQLAKKNKALEEQERKLKEAKAAELKAQREHEHQEREEKKKKQNADLLARLDKLSLSHSGPHHNDSHQQQQSSPKKKNKKLSSTKHHNDEDNEEDTKEAPTKAAQSLASRLGISLDVPSGKGKPNESKNTNNKDEVRRQREAERQRIRDHKANNTTEWDKGKPGTKVDYSVGKKNTTAKSNTKYVGVSKSEVEDQYDSLETEKKLLDDMSKGIKVDWADFDDDF